LRKAEMGLDWYIKGGFPMAELVRTYRRRGQFTLSAVGEETVLVPEEGGAAGEDSVYALNEVAAAIWQLIEPGRDAAEIGRRIAEEFDVSVERASEDVADFLAVLAEKGLVEEV
jgi:hypothetical protein